MIERYGGTVRAMRIREITRGHLHKRIRANVEAGSTIYTDAHRSYRGLDADYVHHVINHAKAYVEGHVHTNNIENFWSCLKRTLTGTYICASPKHMDAYLDEQCYRFKQPRGLGLREVRQGREGRRRKAVDVQGADG